MQLKKNHYLFLQLATSKFFIKILHYKIRKVHR